METGNRIKKYFPFMESLKKDMWSILPQSIKELHQIFNKNRKSLFVVGGSVRDFLLGDKPKDFDLCTNATPDEILEILSGKYKTNLQGKAFGVIVVYTHDQPMGMEIATFRSDTYDGKTRNPVVEYTTIDKDVERRDIAINGLFYDLNQKKIIDLVGGVNDLENRLIRMIGDPEKRIIEDPLRILRVVRFSHRYGFEIDDKTKSDIQKLGDRLSIISKERIWEEIKKSYAYGNNFKHYLDLITDLNLWSHIFPGSEINTNIIECESLVTYLANLFINNNPTTLEIRLIRDYKIESDISSKVSFLIKLVGLNSENVFEMFKSKIKCGIDNSTIEDWIKIRNLDKKLFGSFLIYRPSVSSEELMGLGFKGKSLGDEIKKRESEKFKDMINEKVA